MANVLVVEDDRLFGQTLADLLEGEGHGVVHVENGESALSRAYEEHFDLVMLDIRLPDIDGLSVARELRGSGNRTPILFLTSSRERETLLQAFERGGDDYLTKPVDFDELAARVRALLRRNGHEEEPVSLGEGFSFDPDRRVLLEGEKEIPLSAKNAELLKLLVRNLGRVVTREMIEEALYPGRPYSEGSVRVFVNQLNQVLHGAITNIRGIGYRLEKR